MGAENRTGRIGPILDIPRIDALSREILRLIDKKDVREAGTALSLCIAAIGFQAGYDRSQVLLATIREIENTWLKLAYIKATKDGQETREPSRQIGDGRGEND